MDIEDYYPNFSQEKSKAMLQDFKGALVGSWNLEALIGLGSLGAPEGSNSLRPVVYSGVLRALDGFSSWEMPIDSKG